MKIMGWEGLGRHDIIVLSYTAVLQRKTLKYTTSKLPEYDILSVASVVLSCPKCTKIAGSAGEAHDAPPDPLVGLGRGQAPPQTPPPSAPYGASSQSPIDLLHSSA